MQSTPNPIRALLSRFPDLDRDGLTVQVPTPDEPWAITVQDYDYADLVKHASEVFESEGPLITSFGDVVWGHCCIVDGVWVGATTAGPMPSLVPSGIGDS